MSRLCLSRRWAAALAAVSATLPLAPAPAAHIVWVTENTDAASDPSPDDVGWTDLLEANGHTVDRRDIRNLDTDGLTLEDLEAADLVVVSRDTNSGNYINNANEVSRWNGITTPLIQMSSFLVRSGHWGWFNNTGTPTAGNTFLLPEVADHPIFLGLEVNAFGEIEVAEGDEFGVPFEDFNVTQSADAGNGTVLAVEPISGNVWVALWEPGTEFYPGSGRFAGGRRLWLAGGAGDDDPKGGENFSPAGEQLFLNAVNFLVPNLEGDMDGDGMPDGWEDANGLDKTTNDADGDADADGLSNLGEFQRESNPQVADTDGDGLTDLVETGTGTFVGASDTGTFANRPDSDLDGLRDGAETGTGVYVSPDDTGTDPTNPDSDGDTMPDGFEVAHATVLDPNSAADAALDPDGDSSPNADEFARGTDPEVADTDADGVPDGAESDTGTFVSAADTGTDPLDPDTDNDGLLDGAETGTGVFVSAADTGTDPTSEDSDADTFRDGVEVVFHGTSPVDGADHPDPLDVMFVGGGATPGNGDVRALRIIEDVFGIGSVVYFQATAAFDGDEAGFGLLVLSSTPASGDIRFKFNNSAVPVLNWEEAIADANDGEFGMSTLLMSKSLTATMADLLPGHPVSAGLPARIALFNAPGPETTMTTDLFPGLTAVASGVDGTISAGGGFVGEPVEGLPMLFVAELGDAVDPSAFVDGDAAPARQVMMPFTDATVTALTDEGVRLFWNALAWAAGRGAPEPPVTGDFRFTQVTYTDDPATPTVTLTWTSEPGKTYQIRSSDQLGGPVAGWAIDLDQVPADPGTTTTRQVQEDKLTDRQRFYVAAERVEP